MRSKGYDFIRFTATILIVIWHFITTISEQNILNINLDYININYINFGSIGVGLFFILSGALLINKYIDDINIKEFYKKRIIRIFIPFWITYIIFYLLTAIINIDIINYDKIGILCSLLGLDLFGEPLFNIFNISLLWLAGEWFTTVIVITYLLFPILRYLFKHKRILTTIILLIIFILNLKYEVLTYGNGFFSITNGIMYFWIGMIFNKYKEKINLKIILINIILCIVCLLMPLKNFLWYLPCFIFNVALFGIIYKCKYNTKFTNYICKYNYEIYLTHHRIYILFIPLLLSNSSSIFIIILTFIFLSILILLISEKISLSTNKILNLKTIAFKKKEVKK